MKLQNAFKPISRVYKTPQGNAGYDNARENIDPHIKTKVINSREGTIQKVPVNANDIVNKAYVDALPTGGDVSAALNLTDGTLVQGDGGVKGVKTSTVTAAEVASNTSARHAESHNMASHSDDNTYNINTSGSATIGNGLGVTGNITVTGTVDGIDIATDVGANTSARHTQNTDTALGSGCVAADHGTGTTDQVVNVSYGTSETPPTANTTTEGSLYVQYTA